MRFDIRQSIPHLRQEPIPAKKLAPAPLPYHLKKVLFDVVADMEMHLAEYHTRNDLIEALENWCTSLKETPEVALEMRRKEQK
tara:strand:- start:136 stop:384 length:249 start_codon:yes stop_codon:yes gene_type:complete